MTDSRLLPTLAVALTKDAWYLWCSPRLVDSTCTTPFPEGRASLDLLIPLETDKQTDTPRLVVGHNVGFDRGYVRESYMLESSNLRYLDTMSMHISMAGLTSSQRAIWQAKAAASKRGLTDSHIETTTKIVRDHLNRQSYSKFGISKFDWIDQCSPNGLADVYRLYCGKKLDKAKKEVFIKGSLQDVRDSFNISVNYCASDVLATVKVLDSLLPQFISRFPHPVTLAGILEMGQAFLPINSNWEKYIRLSEETYNRFKDEMKNILSEKAESVKNNYIEGQKYEKDLWLWDLDWKMTKPTRILKSTVCNPSASASALNAEIPVWYKDLMMSPNKPDYITGPVNISSNMMLSPKLLRLTWSGYPLHHTDQLGWGYIVPSTSEATANAKVVAPNSIKPKQSKRKLLDDYSKFPLKQFLDYCSDNNLRCDEDTFKKSPKVKKVDEELDYYAEESDSFIDGFIDLDKQSSLSKLQSSSNIAGPYNIGIEGVNFYKLPHSNGYQNNVGSPLSREYLHHIEEGRLDSKDSHDLVLKILDINRKTSYWRGNRDRIMEQKAVSWGPDGECVGGGESECNGYGAIVPLVVVMGTVTRRGVERTWMTASNVDDNRIGSELKAMIQAPPGYNIVGADVDSEELWIAAVLGDSRGGWRRKEPGSDRELMDSGESGRPLGTVHGSSPLGWMCLQGDKSLGTDMHSRTAEAIGISRHNAKVVNYARIYGAGLGLTQKLLQTFNPQLDAKEAKRKAAQILESTKGVKMQRLTAAGMLSLDIFNKHLTMISPELREQLAIELSYCEEMSSYTNSNVYLTKKTVEALRQLLTKEWGGKWSYTSLQDPSDYIYYGGTESHMFTALEFIANSSSVPRTPALDCAIAKSLQPDLVGQDFAMSRTNWVVQSSAVDYLHLLLTNSNWLFKEYQIDARFILSIHDEVRYLVRSKDRYRAALVLHVSNLYTRSMFAYKLGMRDLPNSVAFFSAVDVDWVMRKEVDLDCRSPSNQNGLRETYGIPFGESLDIHEVLDKLKSTSLVDT